MNILHIDRSTFFQKIIKKGTQLTRATVQSCTTINEGFEILSNIRIDLILVGQELEDGTAADFINHKSKTRFDSIPVIIITSDDNMKNREIYFKLGVVDFISKNNFSKEQLIEHISFFQIQDELIEGIKQSRIAILDDSKISIKVLLSILNLHGIQNIDTYEDPEELLKSNKEYDIYLIDMILPKISGKHMVIDIRKNHPSAIIIVISAIENFNSIVHALESGANDYMIKPFNARFLMARMKSNFRSFQLIKKIEKQKTLLEKMAVTDSLTGIKNRRYLFDYIEREIARSKRHGNPLSMLMIDIDNFKNVNDNFGHVTGDIVLKKLATLVLEECRSNDIFGRYGGEEFILIMPETTMSNALKLSNKLRENFEKIGYPKIEGELRVTFSGGLCQWEGESLEEFLKKADVLLYKAKESGRNRINA
ncbi:MAG: diguanylate cyclase [Spirochaetales bacterium]|nr:diguanylate cyclase [Spirochaetales bacterium]